MNTLVSIYFKHEGSAYEALKQLVDVLSADVVILTIAEIEAKRQQDAERLHQLNLFGVEENNVPSL